ncbi:MAG: pantoate--beta-alanine ligase [Crocinitomicaceae bacterium]|nr:pantoate--beta-alanine ligase [Crocinitomicaceae bacterium]
MGNAQVFRSAEALRNKIQSRQLVETVGLVPTMGALHHGHISLVNKAFEMCDCVVVSIFVNPKQFNNAGDLDKYPRMLEKDVELLKEAGDVLVFAPSVEEVYPKDYEEVQLDLADLGNVMEGRFRPGHFDGVVNVIKQFFEMVKPTHSFFGEKDFQQLAVIQYMTAAFDLPVEIVPCVIVREKSGLASSSRNVRLSEREKEEALVIFDALSKSKELSESKTISEVKAFVKELFSNSELELEYFQIVDPLTLQELKEWAPGAHACMAAFCGPVRLIDNMQLVAMKENQ